MKLVALTFLAINLSLFSQPLSLVKKWDQRYGGITEEFLYSFIQTGDDGFLLAGESFSGIGGDVTQPPKGTEIIPGRAYEADYWIIKTDSAGNKLWDKRYGGKKRDRLKSVCQAYDGGFLLGGHSCSDTSADKSEPCWDKNGVYDDYWIVKTDSLGNKEWDRRYGGLNEDVLRVVSQARDNGFILTGQSHSGLGGNKTDSIRGVGDGSPSDFWIVKVDSVGNKLWDKGFGGRGSDIAFSVDLTFDNGYIFGGSSSSGNEDDRTEPNWDTLQFHNADWWVVKTDSLGNKQWDKRYGGSSTDVLGCLRQVKDGGYILAGQSHSSNGDKSEPNRDNYVDYWVIKTDSLGNKEWDRTYGGNNADLAYTVQETYDGGYLIGGESASPAMYEKSENNLGKSQAWIIKTDSLGFKEWDKTVLSKDRYFKKVMALQTKDSCFVVVQQTEAPIGGDVTVPNRDTSNLSNDFWMIKYCMEVYNPVSNLTEEREMNVYPNPFSSEVSIALKKGGVKEATFTLTNLLGQVVYIKNENNLNSHYTKMLDLSYLPKGVYFVEVIANGERMVRQVVKE